MAEDRIALVEAGHAHAGVLATLHAECLPEAWGAHAYQRLLGLPGTLGVLAFDGGREPAGFALLRVAGEEAEILSIGVRTSRRRRGIARRLVEHATALAAEGGARELFLEVAADNAAAQALYHACGYRAVGRRPKYYGGEEGRRVDALIMRCDIGA